MAFVDPYQRYRVVTSGYSSDGSVDSSPPSHKEANSRPTSCGDTFDVEDYGRPEEFSSFLDCLLSSLAIDLTGSPSLRLDRLPQIGLLLLDFLYNGSQSLQQATARYRRYFKGKSLDKVRLLAKRHHLQAREAIIQDLQVAYGLQLDVLDKVSKTSHVRNTIYKYELYKMGHLGYRPFRDFEQMEPVKEKVTGFEVTAGLRPSTTGRDRVFIKTNNQHVGVGPGDLRVGDEIVVPFGASRPWVLRNHGDHYVLVGDAFVPGIMTGQLEELWRNGDLDFKDYDLR